MKTRKKRKTKKYIGGSMDIVYPSFRVNGQMVSESQTSMKPSIQLLPFRYSTLLFFDPDAIAPPYLHYLVTNIKDGHIESGDVS